MGRMSDAKAECKEMARKGIMPSTPIYTEPQVPKKTMTPIDVTACMQRATDMHTTTKGFALTDDAEVNKLVHTARAHARFLRETLTDLAWELHKRS